MSIHSAIYNVAGTDLVLEGSCLGNLDDIFTGVGPFKHGDKTDRPADIYNGNITVYTGKKYPSSIMLPIIPE